MNYLVFDQMEECTPADVERLLPLAAPERREKALRYKHLFGQWTCLKAIELLQNLGIHDGNWQYNEYGKPYLPAGPQFSISHCKSGVAVAIGESPVGVDIESIRTPGNGLIEKVMNDDEQVWIAAQSDLAVAFTTLWTQKEAVLKLRGTGIIDDLKNVLVGHTERLSTIVNKEHNYVLTIAES